MSLGLTHLPMMNVDNRHYQNIVPITNTDVPREADRELIVVERLRTGGRGSPRAAKALPQLDPV